MGRNSFGVTCQRAADGKKSNADAGIKEIEHLRGRRRQTGVSCGGYKPAR